jgi:hypothetical protein
LIGFISLQIKDTDFIGTAGITDENGSKMLKFALVKYTYLDIEGYLT